MNSISISGQHVNILSDKHYWGKAQWIQQNSNEVL